MARHIKTGIRSLKTPGPGAVAHMSLHLNRQCQRATQRKRRTTNVPRLDTGGLLSVCVGDRWVEAAFQRLLPFGEAAYMEGP